MDIEVQMGDMAVIEGPRNLKTSGVGSCLVVTLYDSKRRIGALAHTMLPSSAAQNAQCRTHYAADSLSGSSSGRRAYHVAEQASTMVRDTKYIDVAIDEMLQGMQLRGAERQDIEAKIVGGANMFSSLDSDIGKNNVTSARDKLQKEGIRIVGECIGGSQGRSVEFSPTTGVVTVKVKF